jgi:hypothetical protein
MKTRLTERDLSRIVRRVVNEQQTDLKPIEDIGTISTAITTRDFTELGGVFEKSANEIQFKDSKGRIWIVTKEWVWQEKGVDDQPNFVSPAGNGTPGSEFSNLFNSRKPL